MKKIVIHATLLLLLASVSVSSQEVIVTNFPLGGAESVDLTIFKPYLPGLKAISDSLNKYPDSRGVIIGGADGGRYRADHDAKNPGVALGRAQLLRNFLISEFHVDSSQLLLQTKYSTDKGAQFRFASIRLEKAANIGDRVGTNENLSSPAVSMRDGMSQVNNEESYGFSGLQVGAGASSSPYGGMPIVAGSIVWSRKVYFEGVFGHTIWNETTVHRGANLDIRHRMAGGAIAYFPYKSIPLGLTGGWVRIEEISQRHYSYVRMSEGPFFGLRWMPYQFFSITGAYNPVKERIAGNDIATSYEDHFMLSATIHTLLGGGR